jgi:hypothetical protein
VVRTMPVVVVALSREHYGTLGWLRSTFGASGS